MSLCRHGVAWCQRCGVSPSGSGVVRVVSPKHKPTEKICIHRSEQIGYVDCGCGGNSKAYRCGVLIRPDTSPAEQAFCVRTMPVKRMKIMAMDRKTEVSKLRHEELVACDRCDMLEE